MGDLETDEKIGNVPVDVDVQDDIILKLKELDRNTPLNVKAIDESNNVVFANTINIDYVDENGDITKYSYATKCELFFSAETPHLNSDKPNFKVGDLLDYIEDFKKVDFTFFDKLDNLECYNFSFDAKENKANLTLNIDYTTFSDELLKEINLDKIVKQYDESQNTNKDIEQTETKKKINKQR